MVTKKDVKDIVVDSLGAFFEDVLEPYFDHERKENKKEHQELSDKIDLIDEHLKDHKKRISKLEDAANII